MSSLWSKPQPSTPETNLGGQMRPKRSWWRKLEGTSGIDGQEEPVSVAVTGNSPSDFFTASPGLRVGAYEVKS